MKTVTFDWVNKLNSKVQKNPLFIKEDTLKENINFTLSDEQINTRTKKIFIKDWVINHLITNWKLLKVNMSFYYFDNINKKLYDLKSIEFKYMLSNITWFAITEPLFKYTLISTETYTYLNWKEAKLHQISHYDIPNKTLYIFTNWTKIIKIKNNRKTIINNWDEWIIFINNQNHKEWNYIKNVDMKDDHIDNLLDSVNYSKWLLTKDEIKLLLRYYLYSIFFASIHTVKPILSFIGQKWSGKSFILEVISLLIYWVDNNLMNLWKSYKDIVTTLISEAISWYDNVDWKIAYNIIDLFCTASTWWKVSFRKLFSNWEKIEKELSSFIAFTSRSPFFNRDDLADRSIIIHLDRRKEYSSAILSKDFYNKNRDIIMSQLVNNLWDVCKKIEEYKTYQTSLRSSDYANFLYNTHKWEEKKISSILNKVQMIQQDFTNSTDDLLVLIESILESNESPIEKWKSYTSSELHVLLATYAKRNSHIVKYRYSSPKSLWKALNINMDSYKNTNQINITRFNLGWNVKKYSIEKIDSKLKAI